MCIEVVIERGVLETEGVGGYFVCLSVTVDGEDGPGVFFTTVLEYRAARMVGQVSTTPRDHNSAGAC